MGLPVHRWQHAGCVQRWGVPPRLHIGSTDSHWCWALVFIPVSRGAVCNFRSSDGVLPKGPGLHDNQEQQRPADGGPRQFHQRPEGKGRGRGAAARLPRVWRTKSQNLVRRTAVIRHWKSCFTKTVKSWRIKVFQKTNGSFGSAMLTFELTHFSWSQVWI